MWQNPYSSYVKEMFSKSYSLSVEFGLVKYLSSQMKVVRSAHFFSRLSIQPLYLPPSSRPTWQQAVMWAVFLIMRWELYCSCLWPGTSLLEEACFQYSTHWQRAPSFDALHSQQTTISCKARSSEKDCGEPWIFSNGFTTFKKIIFICKERLIVIYQ